MLTYDKIKQREHIALEGLQQKQNSSQTNLATLQNLTVSERATQSVRQLNRPNIQSDHQSFISKVFSNNQLQGNDLPSSKSKSNNNILQISKLTRPNTITSNNTPRTNVPYSRKFKDSFNKTQDTPFSTDIKSSHSKLNNYFPTATKEKVSPFSAHISVGQQITQESQNQNFSMHDNSNIKVKETQAQQFVNTQREFGSRRPSLIEAQLQNVFDDKRERRSSFSKQGASEKNPQNKEISAKKSQFAGVKVQTPMNREQIEEKPSMDRFSSTEFMQFAKKKSVLQVEPFYQNQLQRYQQNQQSLTDTSNPLFSKSPQKKLSVSKRVNTTESAKIEEKSQNANTIQQDPLIQQLTLISHNSKVSQKTPSNQQLDQKKQFKETSSNINGAEQSQQQTRTSEQIMKDFFPDITTSKAKFHESAQKKNEYLIQQKKKRLEQYDQIFTELKNKRKTFSKFAFKSHEKQDNVQIRPVLEDLADGDPKGTMSVIDLWSDKNINKFLGNCKLIKDKLLISKIAAIKKKRGFFLDEKKPFLLSRKDELNLINKVYMTEQSKQFQEKYKKQLKKTMQNTSEINRSNLGAQQITVKKLSEQKCTTIGCKHKLCREHLNKNIQQQGLSKKLVEYSLEDEEQVSSSNHSSDSEMSEKEIQQKKMNYNYNQFLRQSNIIKAPANSQLTIKNSMMMSQSKGGLSNKKSLNLVNFLKINNNMIRDLDYLQEQNDKDYVRLVETINTLQDRIVQQKVNNFEAQSSGNEQ